MALRTEFPELPGARVDELVSRLVQILTFVRDFQPTRRSFREWAAERGWWNKEQIPVLWDTFGVQLDGGGKLVLGQWAATLLEEPDPELRNEQLFKYLVRENEILARFVFTELNDQVKGTEQVFRSVTSFAFRGDKPSLNSLRNFIHWCSCTGFLKKIGVAWCLTEKAKAVLPWIESIDVDEILEELAAAQQADRDDDEASGAIAPAPTPPASRPVAASRPAPTPASSAAGEDDADDEEELPDMAPEPPVPAAAAAYAPVAMVPVSVPRMRAPVRFPVPQDPPMEVGVEALTETLARLGDLGRKRDDAASAGVVRAADVGLVAGEYKGRKKPYFIFRLACLGALQHRAPIPPEVVAAAYRRLESDGVFKELFVDNYVLEDVLSGHGWYVHDELGRAASRVLVDLLPLRTALVDGGVKALKPLESAANGDELLEQLRVLSAGALDIELFFVAREMAELGLWGDAADELAIVPDRATRDQAFRLGFIDSPYAHDLETLRHHSRRLGKWFGRGESWGLLLRVLELEYGCRYRCPRVDVCEVTCREKHQVGT